MFSQCTLQSVVHHDGHQAQVSGITLHHFYIFIFTMFVHVTFFNNMHMYVLFCLFGQSREV